MGLQRGWEVFTPECDSIKEMHCRVCGSKMNVERGIDGPTSFAEAMAQRSHKHDQFTCSYSKEDWHKQALAIKKLIEDTPSKNIALRLQVEVDDIISMRRSTKENWKE